MTRLPGAVYLGFQRQPYLYLGLFLQVSDLLEPARFWLFHLGASDNG
jgi:hypothetical protein